MPGPKRGSPGAQRISAAHKGSHDHDQRGGFARDRSLASVAGSKGGHVVKERYGPEFYVKIGRSGGQKLAKKYGPAYFAEIGRRGAESRRKRRMAS